MSDMNWIKKSLNDLITSNKTDHDRLNKKMDDQLKICAERPISCGKSFTLNTTTWKLFGLLVFLVMGSYTFSWAFSTQIYETLIKHIGG